MTNHLRTGVILGVVLAFSLILGGLWGFFLVIVLGGLGGVIGAHFDGLLDLRRVWDSISHGRRG